MDWKIQVMTVQKSRNLGNSTTLKFSKHGCRIGIFYWQRLSCIKFSIILRVHKVEARRFRSSRWRGRSHAYAVPEPPFLAQRFRPGEIGSCCCFKPTASSCVVDPCVVDPCASVVWHFHCNAWKPPQVLFVLLTTWTTWPAWPTWQDPCRLHSILSRIFKQKHLPKSIEKQPMLDPIHRKAWKKNETETAPPPKIMETLVEFLEFSPAICGRLVQARFRGRTVPVLKVIEIYTCLKMRLSPRSTLRFFQGHHVWLSPVELDFWRVKTRNMLKLETNVWLALRE